jgi:hypothetical protein
MNNHALRVFDCPGVVLELLQASLQNGGSTQQGATHSRKGSTQGYWHAHTSCIVCDKGQCNKCRLQLAHAAQTAATAHVRTDWTLFAMAAVAGTLHQQPRLCSLGLGFGLNP